MRYRYIFSKGAVANDSITNYRLFDKQKMQGATSALRIEIPQNVLLEKYDCDEYSTWDTSNTNNYLLSELNPKICVKINGKWKVLDNETKQWLTGATIDDIINKSMHSKYTLIFTLGYITKSQYSWCFDNFQYVWRFRKLPKQLEKAQIPNLTESQLQTLSFVRKKFIEYYQEIIDEHRFFDDDKKEDAKKFYQEWIQTISNDDLAFEWHRWSTVGLDPYHQFETVEMIEKLKKSKYLHVSPLHYKYAIKHIIENVSSLFRIS